MLAWRAQLKRCLRELLDARDWLEIDAPSLINTADFEPNVALFRVTLPDGTPAGSLHASPELSMKRVLSAYPQLPGLYYLGPAFRAGEIGSRHNPEFTMLEWYQTGANLAAGIETTLDLIRAAGELFDHPTPPVEHRQYGSLFREHCDLDPYAANTGTLRTAAESAGIQLNDPTAMSRDDWLDLLMSMVIEPRFDPGTLTVVTGYPASQAAMARLATSCFEGREVHIASRFEVYGGTLELANGYHELTDPAEQARRLETDGGNATPGPTQLRFLAALEHGLPECTGVALGVDRLLMWLTNCDNIDEVLPFSALRR